VERQLIPERAGGRANAPRRNLSKMPRTGKAQYSRLADLLLVASEIRDEVALRLELDPPLAQRAGLQAALDRLDAVLAPFGLGAAAVKEAA
jgi:hypothetical protein